MGKRLLCDRCGAPYWPEGGFRRCILDPKSKKVVREEVIGWCCVPEGVETLHDLLAWRNEKSGSGPLLPPEVV